MFGRRSITRILWMGLALAVFAVPVAHAASQDVYIWTDTEGQERWSNRPPDMNTVAEDTSVRVVTPRFRNQVFRVPRARDFEPMGPPSTEEPLDMDVEADVEPESDVPENDVEPEDAVDVDRPESDEEANEVDEDEVTEAPGDDEAEAEDEHEENDEEAPPWWEL